MPGPKTTIDFNTNTATAILAALRIAIDHGGAEAALQATGIQLPETERFEGVSSDFGELLGASATDKPVSEALALGFLAGRVAHRRRLRGAGDPTSFVMDQHLVVRGAEGESIMRLPWFEDDLFVGRQLPDIAEMPAPVRTLCVETYSAALAGERGRFAFTSYGHSYLVEAVPVYGVDRGIEAVLAIATPARAADAAAVAYERTAERLEASAEQVEKRAELHSLAGRTAAEVADRDSARRSRRVAERARDSAVLLRARHRDAQPGSPPSITVRETEVLQLASHGLNSAEIADQLGVSPTTIKTHFEHIYAKLGSHDRAAAVAAALRHGLID
jgi:DNA-binding NarL/FixJ family response regulator